MHTYVFAKNCKTDRQTDRQTSRTTTIDSFFEERKKILIIRRSHNCCVAPDARTKCTCKNVLWK